MKAKIDVRTFKIYELQYADELVFAWDNSDQEHGEVEILFGRHMDAFNPKIGGYLLFLEDDSLVTEPIGYVDSLEELA